MSSHTHLNISDKVAIVTGASRGIGRAVVRRLADFSVAGVVINYLQDQTAAESAAEAANERGVRTVTVAADVASLKGATSIAETAIKHFGRIDLLICNAGIWEGAPVDEISESLWDHVLDVNLKGTWTICKAVVPHMKRQRFGRIVIISSTAGQRGEANVSNYAASKGGQISFAKSLASELASFGITANVVAPGWVDTEMNNKVFEDAEYRGNIEKSIPLGRVASADDIAYPVVFLCTDWARHITGEVLNVNGGAVLCG